ncbi:MAG: hypothetical protein H7242_17595 [Microbacteriaceae bacterium]|nr:hypothetical protein [Burkholderiaceae bacterium]
MNRPPTPAEPSRLWQRSRPADLQPPATPRPQPPLREVFKGLDVRELEGETVFDQFFGQPPHSAR